MFEKKFRREKEKNPMLVYPGLRFTQIIHNYTQNVCLNTKINLRLKKKHKNFVDNFKNTCRRRNFCRRHQKNASHTISIYGNCMTSFFFR